MTFFTSLILFLLAGVLIGHLLWYRDPSADREKTDHLETRYLQARSSAKERKSQQLSLSKKVVDLEQLAERYQKQVIQLQQAGAAKQMEVDGETQRNESLVSQMQEVLQDRAATQEQAQAHSRSFQALKHSNAELKSEIVSLRGQIDTQSAEAAESTANIEALEKDIELAQLDQQRLADQFAETQRDLAARETDLEGLRDDRDALSQQLQQTINRAIDLESGLAAAADQVDSRYQQVCQELESATTLLAQERETLTRREQELTDTREELSRGALQLQSDQTHQQALEQTVRQREATVTGLEQQLEQLRLENEQLGRSLALLENQAGQSESRRAEADTENQRLVESTARYEARINELAESLTDRQTKAASLEEVVATQQERLEELMTQLESRQSEGEMATELAELQEAELADLREQAAALLPLESELEDVQQDLTRQTIEVARLTEALTQRQREVDERDTELQVQRTEIETIRSALQSHETLQSDLAETSERLSEVTVLCCQLRGRLEQTRSESSEHEALIVEKQSAIDSLTAELDWLRGRTKSLQQSHLESTRLLESELDHRERLVVDQREHQVELQRRCEQLQTANQQHLDSLAEKDGRIAELDQSVCELESVKRQVETYSQQLSQADTEQQSISEARRQLEMTVASLQDQITGHTDTIATLRQELELTSDAHQRMIDESELMAGELQEQAVCITSLKREITASESIRSENEMLRNRVAELMQHLSRISRQHEESLAAGAKAQDRIIELEQHLHDFVAKIRTMRRGPAAARGIHIAPDDLPDRKAA